MPGKSHNLCGKEFIEDLNKIVKPTSCFDVGVGEGKMGKLVKKNFPECNTVGFEIFNEYILKEKENIQPYYDYIQQADFYEWIKKNNDWSVDLIIFGDVLEHFMKSQVIDILDLCKTRCKWIMALIPLDYQQNTIAGNIHEGHLSEITLRDLMNYNIFHYSKRNADIKTWKITYYLIRGHIALNEKAKFKHKFPENH